jgi:hypothetical protein
MLDPRIYRMGLLPLVLAVIVLAFSLSDQQGAATSTLAPDAFNGGNAFAKLNAIARKYPSRRPGSPGDMALAASIADQLRGNFSVSTDRFQGRTLDGTRPLENVVGLRAGQQNGSIVIVADRDALGSTAAAQVSGTAVLLELAQDLSGETLQHTVVLASVDGAPGAAGAARLARTLQQPVDAVIVLGDLAGTGVREPVVGPWSNSQWVAPPMLRNTVAAALAAQTGLPPGRTGLIGQIAHLALPMVATAQGPFGARGEPAVLLSLSGDRTPAATQPTSAATITATGRAVLQAVTALDAAPTVPAPSTYLSFSTKTIPEWAVSLLVLALIFPVLVTTIDGSARARRRGNAIARWTLWVLSAALPFVLAVLLVLGARAVGWIAAAPPGPLDGGAVALHGAPIAVLSGVAVVILAGLAWLRPALERVLGVRPRSGPEGQYGAGAAAGLLLVLCVVALAIWFANPFAALLLAPALHCWMWLVVPDFRLPTPAAVLLLLAGFALPALVLVDYATTLGLGPLEAAWSFVLLLAGGSIGLLAAIEWCVFAGCAFTVIVVAVRAARQPRPEQVPVTIRGPISYAGPGSLGGTKSALRR